MIGILQITDLSSKTEMLTDHGVVTRSRKTNGERQISFDVTPTDGNAHAIDLVAVESIVEFDGEPYVIKTCEVSSLGDSYVKSVDATHKFYVDLINSQQPEIRNGSLSFLSALAFIFNGTNYAYTSTSSFKSQRFENFGNTNRLSLLKTVLERYGAEFKVVGNLVTFSAEISAKTDYQFRYGYNVEALKETYNTQNLATKISGRGANIGTDEKPKYITAEYTSPNASIFGIIEAEPYSNENYTSVETLTEALKEQLQDTPEFSVTVDFAELEEQGVGVINEGDYVHTIYEPINDLYLYTRVMEIVEEFDEDMTLLSRQVTLANFAEDYAQTQLQATEKAMRNIVDDGGKIKFDALDAAVINATRALQSAQTQLKFENGILAIDPTNPDKLVLFNSAGLGVSNDGGATFPQAITGDGVVAEKIFGRSIIGVNLASMDEDGIFHVTGSDAEFEDLSNGRVVKISPDGLFGYESNGSLGFRADKSLISSAALGTTNANVYLAAIPTGLTGEARVVDYNGLPGDGLVDSYTYLPLRASGIYANFINVNAATNATHLYLRPLSNGEVRVTLNDTTDNYMDFRAQEIYGTWLKTNTIESNQQHLFISAPTSGEIRMVSPSDVNTYGLLRLDALFANVIKVNALDGTSNNLYIQTVNGGDVRITANDNPNIYRDLRAATIYSNSVAVTSDINKKKNITDYTKSVLDEIKAMQPKQYHLLEDDDSELKRLGVMLQEAPVDIVDPTGAIDTYAYSTFILKGLQESVQIIEQQSQTIETQKQEIDALKTQMAAVLERLDALETQNGEPSA